MANQNTNADNVERSVGMLYENLLRQRQQAKDEKIQRKAAKRENPDAEEGSGDLPQLTKEEKKRKIEDSWREVMVNLTGDDLEYTKPKKSKKKYRKWLGEEDGESALTKKPKKKKKVNHTKEFEAELGMLKQIVADQNRFTTDLSKRFQNMVGPTAKDAGPLSKTAVELASAVTSARANSLNIIKEVVNVKKTIAQLNQKEKEIDGKGKGASDVDDDLALVGSRIAGDLFNRTGFNGATNGASSASSPSSVGDYSANNSNQSQSAPSIPGGSQIFEEFNPDDWQGSPNSYVDAHTRYEQVPTETIVELTESTEKYRYKTIRTDTSEELPDYPNPTFEVKQIDKPGKMARDSFDTIYRLEVI